MNPAGGAAAGAAATAEGGGAAASPEGCNRAVASGRAWTDVGMAGFAPLQSYSLESEVADVFGADVSGRVGRRSLGGQGGTAPPMAGLGLTALGRRGPPSQVFHRRSTLEPNLDAIVENSSGPHDREPAH